MRDRSLLRVRGCDLPIGNRLSVVSSAHHTPNGAHFHTYFFFPQFFFAFAYTSSASIRFRQASNTLAPSSLDLSATSPVRFISLPVVLSYFRPPGRSAYRKDRVRPIWINFRVTSMLFHCPVRLRRVLMKCYSPYKIIVISDHRRTV